MNVASWRLAVRIARREAGRHRGRSALVIAMIALPVVALTAANVVVRTADLDGAETARRALGTADLGVTRVSDAPITQIPAVYPHYSTEGRPATDPTVDPAFLPGGSSLTELRSGWVTVRTPGGVRQVMATTLDSTSALTDGIVTLLDGRMPTAPDEVAVSPSLSDRIEAGIGAPLRLADGTASFTVVGLAVDPDNSNLDSLYTQPAAIELESNEFVDPSAYTLLVGLPAGTDAIAVGTDLNERGLAVQQRSWLLMPPATYTDPGQVALVIGLATVTVGLALLQVVLLSGAAFAVGARRQRRALGLLAATGATGRDVGRTILAGGLVLGLVAALLGVAAGLLLAWPLRSVIEDLQGTLYGDWHVRWWEIAAVAALGLITGLLAALAPARAAARQDPLRALLERPDPPRSGRRLSVLGLAMAVLGLVVTVFGTTLAPVNYYVILGGAVLVELGFVLCAPALVGTAGRLAGPLPVPLRMALRDASRHRGRSGPAVAAVMAALAGCVAVSIFFVSQDADAKRTYVPLALPGQVTVSYFDPADPLAPLPEDTRRAIEAALPTATLVSWLPVSPRCDEPNCYGYLNWTSFGAGSGNATKDQALNAAVGDVDVLRAALGRVDVEAERALSSGQVVLLDRGHVDNGRATIERVRMDERGEAESLGRRDIPAVGVQATLTSTFPVALMSAELAADLDLVPQHSPRYVMDTERMPTEAELDRLTELSAAGTNLYFQVETGYESPAGPTLLALLGMSVVVVLGATAISTGLAAADGRADLSTLAAVGAAPRTRRLLAMSQAAVVAFLGAALGALAGFVPAAALVTTLGDWPLTIPWAVLGATLVVVPVLAAVFAGLFTRSRLPMIRRTA